MHCIGIAVVASSNCRVLFAAVPEPNLDCFVFCQSTTDLARVQTDDRGAEDIPVHARDRIVLRYRSVQEYVASGDMTLI